MAMNREDILALPLDTPYNVGEEEGAEWLAGLDAVAQKIGCPGCKQEALSLISGMRDLVNVRLKKSVHDPANFRTVANSYAAAALGSLPQCSKEIADKVEQCIQQVKAKGDTGTNPWAVCQSSMGCALPHRAAASQEEEDEQFMDHLIEALKKEGKLE